MYEGGVRVPLMVVWPGKVEAGSTTSTVVHAVDLYPTLLDLLGLDRNPKQIMDGVSFAPVLRRRATCNARQCSRSSRMAARRSRRAFRYAKAIGS